jgi:hypothetical protein
MASDIDAVFDRVAEHTNVPPAQLDQAKHFVRAVVVPALESIRPELEAASRSVTITPASELSGPTDRNVVYSSIRVDTDQRSEIEFRICVRVNASGVGVEPEEISWVQGQSTRSVGWGSSGPHSTSLATLTAADIIRAFQERYARAKKLA